MKKSRLLGVFYVYILILLTTSMEVNAVTITFDDHPNVQQNSYGEIGLYKGFMFGSTFPANRMDWIDTVNSQWNHGSVSGDFTMLNNYGGNAVITEENNADFTFDGLWVKRWRTDPESGGYFDYGYIYGYNDGVLVWREVVAINGSFIFYGAQPELIDELVLELGTFMVDDLSLNGVSAVPIPTALWLFGSGLLGLIGIARKKGQ